MCLWKCLEKLVNPAFLFSNFFGNIKITPENHFVNHKRIYEYMLNWRTIVEWRRKENAEKVTQTESTKHIRKLIRKCFTYANTWYSDYGSWIWLSRDGEKKNKKNERKEMGKKMSKLWKVNKLQKTKPNPHNFSCCQKVWLFWKLNHSFIR